MAETTPTTGVPASAPADPLVAIQAYLEREEKSPKSAPEEAAPTVEPRTDAAAEPSEPDAQGLTPEDIPDETVPVAPSPPADAFEIVHNGEQHKLSREETIRYAQQGFDYTQKTQALAEERRQMDARLQRVAQIEQVAPQLQQAQAQLMALHNQVQRYQGVDWVRLANDDPLEYSKVRAQFDVINQTYQQAHGQYQQLRGAVDEQQRALRADVLRSESAKLIERIPAWKDPEKRKSGMTELRSWLISEGVAPEEVEGLSSSVAASIAYKAMQYDRLLKAKTGKVKELRSAPPLTRPGAAPEAGSAKADRQKQLLQRSQKSGDIRDAAAYFETLLK